MKTKFTKYAHTANGNTIDRVDGRERERGKHVEMQENVCNLFDFITFVQKHMHNGEQTKHLLTCAHSLPSVGQFFVAPAFVSHLIKAMYFKSLLSFCWFLVRFSFISIIIQRTKNEKKEWLLFRDKQQQRVSIE